MILDRQAALERLEQDQELYDQICEIFREDVPRIVTELKTALAANDITSATRHAHSIKSCAANIGADNLSATARSAEQTLRSGNFNIIGTFISDIDRDMALVLQELEKFR